MELVYMKTGRSYETPSGKKFTMEHPYQLIDGSELAFLLMDERFQIATREELKEFYHLNEKENHAIMA